MCGVCGNKIYFETVEQMDCGDTFHDLCIRKYMNTMLDESSAPVDCPVCG